MELDKQLMVIAATVFVALHPESSVAETDSSVISQPDFPVTQLRWWNGFSILEQPWQPIELVVPDQDTTRSAYGGVLRRYDVHIAKMFEVSDYFCQRTPGLEGFRWSYTAANGSIYMGEFKISCGLARDVTIAYGLSRSEATEIDFFRIEPDRSRENLYSRNQLIPVLNISTNGKIWKWREYVQTFQPLFSQETLRADNETVPFPVDKILPRIVGKTQVPILIPNEVPNFSPLVDIVSDSDFCITADLDGYSFGYGPCAAPTSRHFSHFSAIRGRHLLSRSEANPGSQDTFREIELARGIRGIFHEGCGTYCVSSVSWEYEGVLYSIVARFGEQPLLVRIANSAIEAGAR